MNEKMNEKVNDDPPPSYEGYRNFGFVASQDEVFNLTPDPSLVRPTFQNIPFLTEDEAKEAFAKFISEHCCYGKAPIKELKFTLLRSLNSFRYVLQTFIETRSTSLEYVPYSGQPVYLTDRPPQPWAIPVFPSMLFKDEIRKIEVPNTSNIKTCSGCSGLGNKMCFSCFGSGRKTCFTCSGSGRIRETHTVDTGNHGGPVDDDGLSTSHHGTTTHTHERRCGSCSGSGYEGCWTCNRTGRVECDKCRGTGKLRYYIELTVSFKNNEDDFLKKFEEIPEDLIRDCQGQNIYTEQNRRVYPINHHTEADINKASYDLINAHASKFSQSLILAQRQDIYAIPVTNCHYSFNEKMYLFQVYGLDQKVYAPDYPRKCCCCTIL